MSNLALETLLAGAYGGQGGSGGSGGGSGTTNYNDLSNRPKINGVTLSGDKSASDLGIAEYDDTALDARVTAVETALTGKADTSDIPDVSGKANTSDLATVATSGSYNDLSNKPTIPSAYDDSALTERVSDLETDVNDLKTNGASVTVDSTLSDTSENPVQNKVIKAALDGLSVSGVVVDTALSDTSENPVQNKVIKAALDDKADSADIPDISGKANTADLAAVATSGAYSDLTGTPTIPEAAEIATAAKAGLVKPGSGLNITSDGTLVVTTPVDGNTKTAATYTVEYDANTHSLIRRKLADDGSGYDADFTAQTIELPDWSGEIATATQELSDTGWITPDPTNLPNYKYRRKNGYVTVTGNGQVGAVAAKTSHTLFELPVGFRPAVRIDSTAHLANGSTECVCQLIAAVDGRIYVWANTAITDGTSICGSICFPV